MDIVLVVSSAGIQARGALPVGSSSMKTKADSVRAKKERGGVSGSISPSSSKMAPPPSRLAELEVRLGRSRGLSGSPAPQLPSPFASRLPLSFTSFRLCHLYSLQILCASPSAFLG